MNEAAHSVAPSWRATFVASVVVFVGMVLLFQSTALGMVHTWYNFETYTHGFLIVPITLWLIWQRRSHLLVFTPQPSAGFLVPVALGLGVWVLARLTGVLVVEQLAFVAIVISALGGVLGLQVTRFLAFPLLFLFFAVPMGEDLVPPMMEFTASFTVAALKLTGIPVYREGLWFSLPSGNWSVVEACSGVRYLIASVTLGFMYAYVTYHTLWKRILFIAVSAVVPILANGVRAYIIVMIGHLSGMKYATGVDHLIYGWFFFGIVMFILFWIGSYWQEEQDAPAFVPPPRVLSRESVGLRVAAVALSALGLSLAVVLFTMRAENASVQLVGQFSAPNSIDRWRAIEASPLWSPDYLPTDQTIEARYADPDGDQVQLFVALYPQQRQGVEAISQQNKIAADLERSAGLDSVRVDLGGEEVRVVRSKVIVPVGGVQQEHLVWQWYRVAGRNLTNRYEGKAWEALARIYPGRADGAWIAITTPLSVQGLDASDARLQDFARSAAPTIGRAIDHVLGIAD
ncbi:MAG: exosortase A [Chromatiaceae bacterium]|nr:exosortase A [Chromatiaceae bacterium]